MLRFFYSLLFCCLMLVNKSECSLRDLIDHPNVQSYLNDNVYHYDLAVAMIFRDEAPYLKEWIEYYQLLGVQRFYLYNHFSTDNFREVLQPYIEKGLVICFDWKFQSDNYSDWNGAQCCAYMDALDKARTDRVKWMAIIDSDEFMVPRKHDSLVDFLKQYENEYLGGIQVYWVMFGTSYVNKVPQDKLMIETLLLNEGYVEGASKPIVRPKRCDANNMGGPHHQCYIKHYKAIDVSTEEIQCNHYWTRDEDYLFNFKIPRRISWGTPQEVCLTWNDSFNRQTNASEPILRFVSQLRERMGLK